MHIGHAYIGHACCCMSVAKIQAAGVKRLTNYFTRMVQLKTIVIQLLVVAVGILLNWTYFAQPWSTQCN